MTPERVAVVTLVHRRDDHLAAQQRTLLRQTVLPDDYVVVAIDDPGVDGRVPRRRRLPRHVVDIDRCTEGLPLAAARNAGVAAAVERGAECVVLLDVDCLAGPGLVAAYRDVVTARPGTVWSGPVTYLPPAPPGGYDLRRLEDLDSPHRARPHADPGEIVEDLDPDLFWSLSFALHPSAWSETGGFCEEYVGYGGEDTDFARLVLSNGLSLGWTVSARAFHQHHAIEDPPVGHLDDILRNGRIYRDRWGRWPMTGWLEAFEARGLVRRVGDDWVRTRVS
jgi:N-acetylglucosaminyl-diphospho-decaprenol L-rhamnosyltransferase